MSDTEKMVLLATDHHAAFGRPFQSWVRESDAERALAGLLQAQDLNAGERLRLAHLSSGEPTKWYVRAGPITRAQLEEWFATGTLDGAPFPGGDQPPAQDAL